MVKKISTKIALLFALLSLFIGNGCGDTSVFEYVASTKVIPAPNELVRGAGYFTIPRELMIIEAPESFDTATELLSTFLGRLGYVDTAEMRPEETPNFILQEDALIEHEGYVIDVSEEQIMIRASSASGAFYGVQTLRQLMPPLLEDSKNLLVDDIKIPVMILKDAPSFQYRGMHLDVSRHFFPKEFIKKYIEQLALLKINTFHWHLTDDQGWRIEIKQYPDLTKHAAYRDETLVGHYNDQPVTYDGTRYGGFYTQEEVKEIVSFASKHHITVIPEIEMPGHAQAAISAYPELGCTGNQVPVATTWGVFENIYCPKEETFTFLENVLEEVIPLFPGEYIHIGGDEAPKTQWKACDHCQQLIKQEALVDEHGLQSYFIKRIEQFLNKRDKKLMGWDEILEGGLAPNATVMSWRGTEGAIQAAQEGHDVVLTPTSHAYFDYYQDDHPDEPLAIGGYLPLKKVYSFHPIPEEIRGTTAASHVLGAQANIWTEYISTEAQVEYMAFPRMLAMAEVVWSGPTTNLDADYDEFLTRVESFLSRLDILGINYANHLYDVEGAVVKNKGKVLYTLQTPIKNKEIRVRINASEEIVYAQPIEISENTKIEAQVYKEGKKVGRSFTETIQYHKAINATIDVNVNPHPAYGAGGKEALINGVSGSDTRYGDAEWLGYWGDDLEITISFKEPTAISTVKTRFYNANGQWIYAPKQMSIKGVYDGGDAFETTTVIDHKETRCDAEIDISKLTHRKVNSIVLSIPSYGVIPDGLQGAGNKGWTFIDEIIIE